MLTLNNKQNIYSIYKQTLFTPYSSLKLYYSCNMSVINQIEDKLFGGNMSFGGNLYSLLKFTNDENALNVCNFVISMITKNDLKCASFCDLIFICKKYVHNSHLIMKFGQFIHSFIEYTIRTTSIGDKRISEVDQSYLDAFKDVYTTCGCAPNPAFDLKHQFSRNQYHDCYKIAQLHIQFYFDMFIKEEFKSKEFKNYTYDTQNLNELIENINFFILNKVNIDWVGVVRILFSKNNDKEPNYSRNEKYIVIKKYILDIMESIKKHNYKNKNDELLSNYFPRNLYKISDDNLQLLKEIEKDYKAYGIPYIEA
jgi:hypothetical protein